MSVVVGRVVIGETGRGIGDLLVELFEVDQQAADRATIEHLATDGAAARRLGSSLTERDGRFRVEYSPSGAPSHDRGHRPALRVTISSPEGPGGAESRVLYASKRARRDAGSSESFAIRLPLATLREAGLMDAGPGSDPDAEALSTVAAVRRQMVLRDSRTRGIRGLIAERVRSDRAESVALEPAVSRLLDVVSRIPAEMRDAATLVRGPFEIAAKTRAVVARGLAEVIPAHELRFSVRLDAAGRTALGLGSSSAGAALPAPVLEGMLFGQRADGSRSVSLERVDLLNLACSPRTFSEDACAPAAASGAAPAPSPETTSTVENGFDEGRYLERLMGSVAAPDALPPSSQPATEAHLQDAVARFTLRAGPADVASLYDFFQLQLAFEHVWQQVLDPELAGTARDLYRKIVELGGDPPEAPTSVDDALSHARAEIDRQQRATGSGPPPHVASLFEVSAAAWAGLTPSLQSELSNIAYLVPRIESEPEAHAAGAAETYRDRAQQIIRAAVVHPGSIQDLNQTLAELEERIRSQYPFTVYAAGPTQCSLNFGLLNHYRQRWEPGPYQTGRMVRTIPLAPKEVRKYSSKLVLRKTRATREVEGHLQSRRGETADTTRLESEIVRKAENRTNFKLTAEGGVELKVKHAKGSTSFERDAATTSNEVKRQFREAVRKSAEELKDERSVEVATSEAIESEAIESGEISNPNDAVTVTYLFYELQRRYRVSEQLHRVTPIVLVAQEVPPPSAIDNDWLIAHDWILRRVILDDSFLPALAYVTTRVVGDEYALEQMSLNVRQQRDLVDKLREELVAYRAQTGQRYGALESAIERHAIEEARGDGGGLLGIASTYLLGGGGGDRDEAARIREDAAKEAAERAAREERDFRDRLEREITGLGAATEAYTKALADHLNRKTEVTRLRAHIKQNILHYMQAIWAHEPPDQRYFRLHKLPVPRFTGQQTYRSTGMSMPVTTFAHLGDLSLVELAATVRFDAPETETLAEVADLDELLGFKGNYMIFPLKRSNVLTDFMMAPYADPLFGLRDPGLDSEWTLADFQRYVCCLKQRLTASAFSDLRDRLQSEYEKIVAATGREEEVVVPTGSLVIEALPGAHPVMEDFKLAHRLMDVRKAAAEVRFAELENVRAAARLAHDERKDPKIDKTIVVEGAPPPVVVVPE